MGILGKPAGVHVCSSARSSSSSACLLGFRLSPASQQPRAPTTWLFQGRGQGPLVCLPHNTLCGRPTGQQRFAFEPGHGNNIFQARAIPNTGDKTIVSCAADGQVRAWLQLQQWEEGCSAWGASGQHGQLCFGYKRDGQAAALSGGGWGVVYVGLRWMWGAICHRPVMGVGWVWGCHPGRVWVGVGWCGTPLLMPSGGDAHLPRPKDCEEGCAAPAAPVHAGASVLPE